jgi:hypothetical protein
MVVGLRHTRVGSIGFFSPHYGEGLSNSTLSKATMPPDAFASIANDSESNRLIVANDLFIITSDCRTVVRVKTVAHWVIIAIQNRRRIHADRLVKFRLKKFPIKE